MEYAQLKSGRVVAIRSIREDDADRLEAAYARLSPDSRYRRFLAVKSHLTTQDLRYLTHVDGFDHVALIATPDDEPERIIGVGRFVREQADPEVAEFAIVVDDDYQGEGLATELLTRLAVAGLERGVVRFTATVLADNVPIHRLLGGLAGTVAQERANGPVQELTVDLAA